MINIVCMTTKTSKKIKFGLVTIDKNRTKKMKLSPLLIYPKMKDSLLGAPISMKWRKAKKINTHPADENHKASVENVSYIKKVTAIWTVPINERRVAINIIVFFIVKPPKYKMGNKTAKNSVSSLSYIWISSSYQ